MAIDFIDKMISNSVLGDEFFKALDEVTKNIQTNVHTVCEKWKNGELVSKDEEKYENGKKTLDIHQSKNIELEDKSSELIDKDEDKGCVPSSSCNCNGACEKCKHTNAKDEINSLKEKNKSLTNAYEEMRKVNSDLYQQKVALENENVALKEKLNRFKKMFENEF